MADKPLPEGTDAILDEDGIDESLDQGDSAIDALADLDEADAAALIDDIEIEQDEPATASARVEGAGAAGDLRQALFGRFEDLRGEATDRAFSFAQTGKDRATSALDDIVHTVEDAAAEIDAKIGTQYGDYARRAAEGIGGFSEAFKAKNVDELFGDARELVKKSPAVAIGAAAALGFVVARLVKAGVPDAGAADQTDGARKDARAA